MSAQRDGAAVDKVPALRELVFEEDLAQIFRMHARGHAGGIRVPGHHVDDLLPFAQEIVAEHARPDQVVRAQKLEGAGHLASVEIADFLHHVFEVGERTVADKEIEFARLTEIGLRGQQASAS